MTTRAQLCEAALALVGTPFHAQGRVPGIGLDCVGVIVCAARACGITVNDRTNYPMLPDGTLQGELESRLIRVRGEPEAGDILMMSFGRAQPHHVAMLVDGGRIVHSHMKARKTVVQTFTDYWRGQTRATFRFKGVV